MLVEIAPKGKRERIAFLENRCFLRCNISRELATTTQTAASLDLRLGRCIGCSSGFCCTTPVRFRKCASLVCFACAFCLTNCVQCSAGAYSTSRNTPPRTERFSGPCLGSPRLEHPPSSSLRPWTLCGGSIPSSVRENAVFPAALHMNCMC